MIKKNHSTKQSNASSLLDVGMTFFRLGLTSFGGPVAHLSFFHDEFVKRKKWFTEQTYADLVALCQFLPGPASSQVGIAIGLSRAGVAGSILAWLGFTLPSALFLAASGIGLSLFEGKIPPNILHGLKLVAVPVVAQALWNMGKKLCYEKIRLSLAILGLAITNIIPFGFAQTIAMICGAVIGRIYLKDINTLPHTPLKIRVSKQAAALILILFISALFLLPILAKTLDNQTLKLFDSFFRSGSLVFGGGHVVLPLLKSEVVNPGWVNEGSFMAGYGLAQAIPGPLFSFTAYLGAVMLQAPTSWLGAILCLFAAFLPSFFLVFGTLPFWEQIRKNQNMRASLQGVNAIVVGLLLAAFFDPVWSSAIFTTKDFTIAAIGFLLLESWHVPSWIVVILSALL